MILDFISPFPFKGDDLEKYFQKILEITEKTLDIHSDKEIDCSLVTEEEIQEVNKMYRNIDRVTDVISFAFEDDESEESFVKKDQDHGMLGEILICLKRAEDQAHEYGHSLNRELCFLFTHGLLHLLGYDHMKKEDEEVMFPLQDRILEQLGGDYGHTEFNWSGEGSEKIILQSL